MKYVSSVHDPKLEQDMLLCQGCYRNKARVLTTIYNPADQQFMSLKLCHGCDHEARQNPDAIGFGGKQ